MKKVLLLLLILFLFPLFADAKKVQNNFIDIINEFDADVESIGYQIQILEKIRNKQKSENNFNE